MAAKTSLLELLTPEDRKKVLEREEQRVSREAHKSDVTPEVYVVAEFGYYFGWEAVMAIKTNTITLDEVYLLLSAARKVWASKVIDMSSGVLSANSAVHDKEPIKAFQRSMDYMIKEAKL